MARARQRSEPNLDSLLDTLANVVGILVVLIAVTQISVGDAVDRIRQRVGEQGPVDPARAAQAEEELAGLQVELAAARADWQSGASAAAPEEGLLIDEVGALLDELQALPGARTTSAAELPSRRARVRELESDLAARSAELGSLQALLAAIDAEQAAGQPRIVRLPDPRPPRPASEMIAFFCRAGRVLAVDLPALEQVLDAGVRAAVGAPPGERIFDVSELPWIENHFAKEVVGRDGFRWKFRAGENGVPTARLEWQDVPQGEVAAELVTGASRHADWLRRHDAKRRYAYYFVWADSFDVYLAARNQAEELGFEVGWEPLDPAGELIGYWQTRGADSFQTD